MHALVTGGGGFLGGYIVEALLARGDTVRSFGRGDYPQLRARGVDVVRGDIRDNAAIPAACAGIECVFHCAALPGIGMDRDAYESINQRGTELLLANARRQGVKRLVYTSSPSVVFAGEDQSGVDESAPYDFGWMEANRAYYSYTKACAEQAVLAANSERDAYVFVAAALNLGAGRYASCAAAVGAGPLRAFAANWGWCEPGGRDVCRECSGCPCARRRRAGWRGRFSGRESVLYQPRRTSELLAVDRRGAVASALARNHEIDVIRLGAAIRRRDGSCLPVSASPRRAADDAVLSGSIEQVPLVRHLSGAPRFGLRTTRFDGGGDEAIG